MENLMFLASLSVTQFRGFRKALALLVRCGMHRDVAIDTLLTAMQHQSRYNEPFNQVKVR